MQELKINLCRLIGHGDIDMEYDNQTLRFITGKQNTRFWTTETPVISFLEVPGYFKLPVTIDLVIRIDSPAFYLLFGKGHLTFGSGVDNRSIDDIIEPNAKKTRSFINKMEMNKDVSLSVTYGLDFMQVSVDGEVRYYSKKEKYMKLPQFAEQNAKGFSLKLACSKLTRAELKSIRVTQFEEGELSMPPESVNGKAVLGIDKSVKSDLQECMSMLAPELQRQIVEMDGRLLAAKKLKIKRKIEGDHRACKINYVSAHGFSYAMHIYENVMDHFFWWYMVSNYKYENKYMGRKNDLTAQTFDVLGREDKEAAGRLFSCYNECIGCSQQCTVKTFYTYNGEEKASCHGQMMMNMNVQTFSDLHRMFHAIEEVIC